MEQVITFFTGGDIISLVIKLLVAVLAFIYIIYAVVLRRQIKTMLRTVTVSNGNLLLLIGSFQILLGIILLTLSFLIL